MRVWASVEQFRAEIADAPTKRLYAWATLHPEHVWKANESRNSTMLLRVEAVLKAMDDHTL